jgi:hypothetical protein
VAISANPSCPSAAGAGRPDHLAHPGPRCGGVIPDSAVAGGAAHHQPPNPFVKEQLVHSRIGWGQPPPGWGQSHFPGWAPLVDPGPRPLQAARSLGRWWWPTLTVAGFLAVLAYVVDHDPSTPGLSSRGLLTVALAATVVALLTIHRRYGPRWLARAVAEYATVALLAALLVAPAGTVEHRPVDHPDSGQARAQAVAGQDQPAVIRAVTKVARAGAKLVRGVTGAVRWLVELWHRADQQATAKGEAMATPPHSPTSSAPSIWRSPA